MRAPRPLRPASHSRPLPPLERLAASLAVTSAVVVPAAALLLRDNPCPGEGATATQRLVRRLESAGAFRALTDGAWTTPGTCALPPSLQPPQMYMPPRGGAGVAVPSVPPPAPVSDERTRIAVGGAVPVVRPMPESHQRHTYRFIPRGREDGQLRQSPAPRGRNTR